MSCKRIHEDDSSLKPGALYVHVPFCLRKCLYCDFYSRPYDAGAAAEYVHAVADELAAAGPCLRAPLDTVYVGGGTPTSLEGPLLRRLLAALKPLAGPQTEFTVEANPGTVREPVARMLADGGVNRVALGAQSFQPQELRTLGRLHAPQEVRAAVETLRACGIPNVGLDLIYGIPGQTPASWRQSVAGALSLQPEHLSAYALAFEEGTPLQEQLRRGEVRAMEEPLQKECYFAAIEAAEGAGLEHYEISNFARPGCRCRHNLTYWHNRPYRGIGPAAASYVGGVRRVHAPDLVEYVRAIRRGQTPPFTQEQLTGLMAMAETLMLGLRLVEGIDRPRMAARFGVDPLAALPQSLRRHADLGTLLITGDRIRIPRESLFVSDSILADIVAEAAEGDRKEAGASLPAGG